MTGGARQWIDSGAAGLALLATSRRRLRAQAASWVCCMRLSEIIPLSSIDVPQDFVEIRPVWIETRSPSHQAVGANSQRAHSFAEFHGIDHGLSLASRSVGTDGIRPLFRPMVGTFAIWKTLSKNVDARQLYGLVGGVFWLWISFNWASIDARLA